MGKESSYEKISATAWGVAYRRTFSDIKYAKEIFDELDKAVNINDPVELDYMESIKKSKISPQFEARYKLISRLLENNKTNQILELASGLSPRGLAMAEANPSLQYVELELPAMAEQKRKILQNLFLQQKANPRKNLRIKNGDALKIDSLLSATSDFKNEPISVINEGLLRYLDTNQKTTVAKNIHLLLEKFGGAWITSDISLEKLTSYAKERAAARKRILTLSGINVKANSFKNEESARKFFEDLGFSVERHGFFEIADKLVSPKKLGLSPEEIKDMLKSAVVFVMKIRPKVQ